MPEKVAVVVPFHKSTLTVTEAFALSQIVKTLKSYPLLFVLPAGIDPAFVKASGGKTIYFPAIHFQSILNYDRLFCSLEFYETFSSYSHILVAQLDSIVFSDQLAFPSNAIRPTVSSATTGSCPLPVMPGRSMDRISGYPFSNNSAIR
jgi:hypothetical protein